MDKKYSFSKFAPSLSDKSQAESIFLEIQDLLPKQNKIIVDLSGIAAMTTICARLIFGRLYVELGTECFSKNIILKNIEESVQIVIRWGILKELEQPSQN